MVEALPVDIVWFEREVEGFDVKDNTKKGAVFIESLAVLASIERLSPLNYRKHFQFKKSIMTCYTFILKCTYIVCGREPYYIHPSRLQSYPYSIILLKF